MIITTALAADLPEIERLLDEGFGPARHNRTAYRLRAGETPIAPFSLVARSGKDGAPHEPAILTGSLQCWRIALTGVVPARRELILLGPVAVAASHRNQGVASALVHEALDRIDAAGGAPVLLIGDAPFYGRFGFSAGRTGGWMLPGPVDPARLLLHGGGDLPSTGHVGPANRTSKAA